MGQPYSESTFFYDSNDVYFVLGRIFPCSLDIWPTIMEDMQTRIQYAVGEMISALDKEVLRQIQVSCTWSDLQLICVDLHFAAGTSEHVLLYS